MKKLFFTTLVAVAAIGGAYAIDLYDVNGVLVRTCQHTAAFICNTSGTYFDANGNVIPPSQYYTLRYN